MRRGGPLHPKVQLLAAALGIPRPYAVGLLECLWHFTAQYAPRGDVGKYSDAHIASAVGWQVDDAGRLVEALQQSRFVEADSTHRLLIHDWCEHADQSVQRTLTRQGTWFIGARKNTRKAPSKQASRRLAVAAAKAEAQAEASSSPLGVSGESEGRGGSFAEFYEAYPRHEARDDAEKAWRQTAEIRPPFALLMATVHRQKANNFAGREKKHIPLPASWLRGGRWKDEIVPYEPPKPAKVTTMDAARNVAAQWMAEGKIAL